MSYVRKMKFVEKREGRKDDSSEEGRKKPSEHSRRENGRQNDYRQDLYVKDERKITASTVIEALPDGRRNPPNEASFKEKLAAINKEISDLKQQRSKEKDKFRELTKEQRDKISKIADNIKLGEDCIKLLERDLHRIEGILRKDKEAITELERKVEYVRKPAKKERKPDDILTYEELQQQINRLESQLSRENLDKKASEAINRDINKLKTQQVNAPHETSEDPKQKQGAESNLTQIARLREQRNKNIIKKIELNVKIDAISNQMIELSKGREAMIGDLEKLKDGEQYTRAKEIKEKILQLRKERENLEAKFDRLINQYREEQRKVDYILWATEIKKKRKEEEDYERERRKKERLREQQYKERFGDEKEKEKGGKDNKPKDPREAEQEQRRFRPPPPHPFAKQITDCRFLISYCENIKPKDQRVQESEQKKTDEIDLQAAIKQGQWAKEKGITIIQSKKRDDDDLPKKPKKVNKSKVGKEQLPTLEHTIEIVRMFDSFKIMPPTKNEEIDQVIEVLKTKATYYKDADPSSVPHAEIVETKAYRKKEEDRPKRLDLSTSAFPEL